MKNKILLSLPAFLFFLTYVSAQKYSNEFLSIGVGARAQGMSGAVSATTNDVFAGYWNPAGLTELNAPFQIGAMHAEWFAGVAKYDFIGLAKIINEEKKSVVGLSIIRFGIDNIPYTLNLIGPDGSINYDKVTQFSSADYALNLTYAQQWKGISIGGNLKIIRRTIGSFAGAWGFGGDLGLQYKKGNWRFGAMARDLTTTFNAWTTTLTDDEKRVFTSTGNDIPKSSVEVTKPTLTLATAYRAKINSHFDMTSEIDANLTTDGQRNVLISSSAINIDPKVGVEIGYDRLVWFRFGVGNIQRYKDETDPTKKTLSVQPNIGLGVKVGRLYIDYALTNLGNVSQVLYSNIFSLKLDIQHTTKPNR